MNILLIAIDTLRADHMSCYGYPRCTTPHLDRLAARGVVFEECFAPHIPTHPSFTSLFTGKDVMTHQIVAQGGKVELKPKHRTLAQILRRRGYFTAAADSMGRWFKRGFDVYEGYHWEHPEAGGWRKAEAATDQALQVLAQCAKRRKPWFCFLHYWDPHTPYMPPPPFDRMFYTGDPRDPRNAGMDRVWTDEAFRHYFAEWMPGVTDIEFPRSQYDGAVAYCDASLAPVFTMLEQRGLMEETLIVVTADHGEELDEHGMWFDHHGLYDTNLHIPLIMVCPERLAAGKRLKGMVRNFDIAPTILELAGCGEAAVENAMEGTSVVPALDGRGPAKVCDAIYMTECAWMRKRGVRTRRHKLILARETDYYGNPDLELYDLQADPGEQHNLADEQPAVVRRLQGMLDAWLQRRLAETGLPDPIETQRITMRQIGDINRPIPRRAAGA